MIESITIKNVASYDNQGITITNLKHVNFIYGANACGKTTISNFLAKTADPVFNDCSVAWKDELALPALVYNKKFRDENFSTGKIVGIFTLGKATKEEIEAIETKKKNLDELRTQKTNYVNNQNKLKESKATKDDEYKNYCWNGIYKKYEGDFKEALKGSLKSDPFKTKIIDAIANNKAAIVALADLKERSTILFGKEPSRLQRLSAPDHQRVHDTEKHEIWATKVVGKADIDIAGLINRLNSSDWVNKGREYLQEGDTCPFCQQNTISNGFRAKLEAFFDESFTESVGTVNNLQAAYDASISQLITTLSAIETVEKANEGTKLNVELFSAHLKTLVTQYAENKEFLKQKQKEMSCLVELVDTTDTFNSIIDLINKANTEIDKHNHIVDNFKNEQTQLIKDIWRFLANEAQATYDKYVKETHGIQTGIEKLNGSIKTATDNYNALDTEIKDLTKNVTSIQPAVDEINKLLTVFGFHSFSLVKSDVENFYQIQRDDGSIAHATLSEGEITFITFLYYLQYVNGAKTEENVTNDRIIVIDDPISSLDSSVLFIVSSLIKEIIKQIKDGTSKVKQLVLLTHNVYFHKEVSFIDGRTKKNGKTHYWILRKNNKHTQIEQYEQQNPIESSYELLWREIKNHEKNSGITIQNTMRRIIENYFKMLGKYGDDDLLNKFEAKNDKEICRSLLCWINDGSHCMPDDLFIQTADNTIEQYQQVFKAVFEHTDNIGHYNMMMGIVPEHP